MKPQITSYRNKTENNSAHKRTKKEKLGREGGKEQEEGEGEEGHYSPTTTVRERGGGGGWERQGKGAKKGGERERERERGHCQAKTLTAAATEAEVPTRQEDGISWVCDTDDTLCSEVLLIITVLFLLAFVPLLLSFPLPIMVLGFVFNAIDLL